MEYTDYRVVGSIWNSFTIINYMPITTNTLKKVYLLEMEGDIIFSAICIHVHIYLLNLEFEASCHGNHTFYSIILIRVCLFTCVCMCVVSGGGGG